VTRWRGSVLAVAVGVLGVSGCGGDRDDVTALEASRVVQRLEQVREQAADGDVREARAALRTVRRDVRRLAGRGALEPRERQTMSAGLSALSRALDGRASPPKREETDAAPPATEPPEDSASAPAEEPPADEAPPGQGEVESEGGGKDEKDKEEQKKDAKEQEKGKGGGKGDD
jgi:hypothetical protein